MKTKKQSLTRTLVRLLSYEPRQNLKEKNSTNSLSYAFWIKFKNFLKLKLF